MIHRIFATHLEEHPYLGWLGSVLSVVTGVVNWLIHHQSTVTTGLGWAATIFGVLAGYYTWRIQRLRYKRLVAEVK